jgi:hypothetical protein
MPTCFVVMPLTTPKLYLEQHRDPDHFQHVLKYLFSPALKQAGYEVISPLSVGSELIHAGIIKNLEQCELVLCDISSHNPNVFFELGIRTSLDKPVVLVKDSDTSTIPFDTGSINTFTYSATLEPWLLELELPQLVEHIVQTVDKSGEQNALWRFFGLTQRGQPAVEENPVEAKFDLILAELSELKNSSHASNDFVYTFDPTNMVYTHAVSGIPSASASTRYYSSISPYGLSTSSFQPSLTALENAPANHQLFARQAQSIASGESIEALSVQGYDPQLNALILDSGNWPLSIETIKKIAAVAQSLGVEYRLRAPE